MKAIIFDFDGVLGQSEETHFQVLQKAAEKFHIIIPDKAIKKKVGRTTLTFLHDIFSESEKKLIPQIVAVYEKEFKGNITKYVQPIPATVDFIRNYRGSLVFAVSSGSDLNIIETILKHFGIYEKFKVIVCKNDVLYQKPDPEIFLKAADRLTVSPKECIVIEDTTVGVQAALCAGMECFVVLNGLNDKAEFSGLEIEGFITSKKDLEKISRQII